MFLPSLQTKKLSDLLRDEFFNQSVQDEFSSILVSIFSRDPVAMNIKARRYVNTFSRVTNENNNPRFNAGINGFPNMFQVDMVKKFEASKLERWADTGFQQTNQLRKDIPNFQYVYHYFNSSEIPIVNDIITAWPREDPNDSDSFSFLLREYIPGENMETFMLKCSPDVFLQIFSQIFFAVDTAYSLFGYNNSNLRYDSVIIRDLGKEYLITYEDVFVSTRYLAVITENSLFKTKSDPFGDVGRFFETCIALVNENKEKNPVLYKFFKDNFNMGSGIRTYGSYKSDIRKLLGLYEINESVPGLNCNSFPCKKKEDLEYISNEVTVNNFLDLYELNEIRSQKVDNLDIILRNSVEEINNLFREVGRLESQIWYPSMQKGPNPTDIHEIGNYRRFVLNIGEVYRIILKIRSLLQFIIDYHQIITNNTSNFPEGKDIFKEYKKRMYDIIKIHRNLRDLMVMEQTQMKQVKEKWVNLPPLPFDWRQNVD